MTWTFDRFEPGQSFGVVQWTPDRAAFARWNALFRTCSDDQVTLPAGMTSMVALHGTMSFSLIWEALSRTLGPVQIARTTLDVRFLAPVRIDERVTVGGEQRVGEAGCFDVWARTAAAVVIEGVARVPPA